MQTDRQTGRGCSETDRRIVFYVGGVAAAAAAAGFFAVTCAVNRLDAGLGRAVLAAGVPAAARARLCAGKAFAKASARGGGFIEYKAKQDTQIVLSGGARTGGCCIGERMLIPKVRRAHSACVRGACQGLAETVTVTVLSKSLEGRRGGGRVSSPGGDMT